jgi:DNA-binding winged helix-turn-helix (wHTH) protein/tetratricopeptide (TPR) repeat protein
MWSGKHQDFSGPSMTNEDNGLYEFGPFRLDAVQRLLLRDDCPIPLQPKAFDTLLLLVRNSEKLVLKDELLQAVWANTFVQEANLTQNIFVLRKALGDNDGGRRYIITVPGRGYRFVERVRTIPEAEQAPLAQEESHSLGVAEATADPPRGFPNPRRFRTAWIGVSMAAVLVGLAIVAYLHFRRRPGLTDKDTIVLADFANTTGDPVFDGSLRQGLSIQLEQSPFLNLLSDQRIEQTLMLMARPKDTRLTAELAREVCQRTGSAAVLSGFIAQVGTRYLLTLCAVNCSNGDQLASATAQASDKNQVLDALGRLTTEIRPKLGESLASVQKLDTPLENVTTPSLEALQVYSLGHQSEISGHPSEAIGFYERAIGFDPNFATAYVGLGVLYFNDDETFRAEENLRKAYQLRERVSQREKLGIAMVYDAVVTRNFEASRASELLFTQIYPRESRGFTNLATFDTYLGYYDEALAAAQQALTLNPASVQNYSNLLINCMYTNRLSQAAAIAKQAEARNLDSPYLHGNLYLVDFVAHDTAGMEREAAAALSKGGSEDLVLSYQSDTAAYNGQFALARQLTRRAADSALHANKQETAAAYEAEAAVREALVGNLALANQQANDALKLSNGRNVTAMAAITFGLAGDPERATHLANDLGKRFPEDTALRYNLAPAIRAAAALRRGEPGNAIESLTTSLPYETGQTSQDVAFALYPIYLRGEAYLEDKQGAAAAAEFQKILDHPGLVQNELIGALARVELARAHGMAHESAKAKTAYGDFLALWKGADADLPTLKRARSEYEKIK